MNIKFKLNYFGFYLVRVAALRVTTITQFHYVGIWVLYCVKECGKFKYYFAWMECNLIHPSVFYEMLSPQLCLYYKNIMQSDGTKQTDFSFRSSTEWNRKHNIQFKFCYLYTRSCAEGIRWEDCYEKKYIERYSIAKSN